MGERRLTDEELAYLDKMDDILPTSRAFVRKALAEIREHRAAFRKLHAQVDLTDPACPVGVALTRAGAARGGYGPDDIGLDRLQLEQLETRDVASPRVSRLSPDEIDALAWAVARADPRGASGHGLDDFDRHNRALAVIDKLLGLRGGR